MNVVIFGATGMVGHGVLLEALDSRRVQRVLSVGRGRTGLDHPKLEEIVHDDLADLGPLAAHFQDLDACFWCVGMSAVGATTESYTRVTVEYATAAAHALLSSNPALRFCFVSAEGVSDDGGGRVMWARVKGEAERALRDVGLAEVIVFRPGYVKPMRGIRRRGAVREMGYTLLGLFNPLLRLTGNATTTLEIGRAMVVAGLGEAEKPVLDSVAINRGAVLLARLEKE